jgi:hypothetical protein
MRGRNKNWRCAQAAFRSRRRIALNCWRS